MNTFTIKEAVSYGWQKIKEHFWFVVGAVFLASFLPEIARGLIETVTKHEGGVVQFVGGLLSLVISLAGAVLLIGLFVIFLKLYNNESADYSDLYEHYSLFWKFVFTHILYTLIVIGGLILLLVPGIIWALKYSFALLLVVDKHLGPVQALKESGRITNGYKWQLFRFGVVIVLLNILGFILVFVGLLITIPITVFASVYVYKKLLDASNGVVVEATLVSASVSTLVVS